MDRRAPALLLGFALGLSAAGCTAEPEPSVASARPPGLIRLAQVEQSTPSPHLTEVAVVGEHVFVGNSNDQVAVYELLPDGGLELVVEWTGPTSEGVRCTSITAHTPTSSLYCGNDEYRGIVRFDIEDPLAPVRDAEEFNPPLEGLRVADMISVGDRLVMARYDRGIATAQIGADGGLSGLVEQLELGNVRRLDVDDAGRLWALTSDRGLLVLEPDPGQAGAWIEHAQLDIDGAALGLGVDGARAAVGLGSGGLALVELSPEGLRSTHALRPPGVVSAADVRGDVAVAVTLHGVYAYDLREPERWPEDPRAELAREAFDQGGARLLGMIPAGPWDHPGGSGVMLDGRLFEHEGELELITSDWTWVERVGIDIDGFPAAVDVRRGEFVAAEDETVELPLRNPTPFVLHVEFQVIGDELWQRAELEPDAITTISLAASRLEIDTPQLVIVRVYDGDEVVDAAGVSVLRRAPVADYPVADYGRPPPGAAFMPFTLATGWPGDIEPLAVPTKPGVAQRVVFYGLDCAAMWPEVEDLLWRIRSGRLDRDEVVLVSHVDPTVQGAFERWDLGVARWGYFESSLIPAEIAELNPYENLYEDGFVIYELPSAAHHPTDYVVDEQGIVSLVEREYRGEHELQAR